MPFIPELTDLDHIGVTVILILDEKLISNILLGDSLTIEGTNGVNTTVTSGKVEIAVDELDGGSF